MFFKTKSSVSALTDLSIELYENKKYKEVEKICRKVLKAEPDNYAALINLGNLLFLKK